MYTIEYYSEIKNEIMDGCWWLIPVILAPQEAEIGRIMVQSQFRQIVHKSLPQKYPTYTLTHTKGWQSGSSGKAPA
jgi:hypothetical protein